MCLSIIWYHAGLMPGWEKKLDELDKKVNRFIWKGTMAKVARATLLVPKEERGLGLWSLKAKNNAFCSSWILKLSLGKLNPYLEKGALVAQWYNTYLLDYWLPVQSRPAAVHFSHKKDVLAMMVIDSSMEVCPVLLVPPKYK